MDGGVTRVNRVMRNCSVVLTGLLVVAGCSSEAETAAAKHPGEQIYLNTCFSCHASGMAGAPAVGDAEAWSARVAKGRDALLQSTLEGMPPGMPAKGLCADCTDEELGQAIDYMIENSQASAG